MPITIDPKPQHLLAVVAVAVCVAVASSAYDARRCRRILEDDLAAASAARAQAKADQEAAAKEPPVCRKEASGLDRDVPLGVATPCPSLKNTMCLTYQGQTLTVQAWSARCAAGRL